MALYEKVETDESFSAVSSLSKELPDPIILLGGWAVYYQVNESYQKERRLTYLGSRDVDIGFHISKTASPDEIKKGHLARSIEVLKKIGYMESGTSRYCRIINKNDGRTLTEAEAARYQQYDLFYLYVDPIVDYIHPALKDVIRIQAIDEPLLGKVIDENKFDKIYLNGKEILLPCSNMLLMMKLNSFPNRTKDDKKVKDLCDIVSLIWYSGLEFAKVIESAKNDSRGNINILKDQLNSELLKEVAKHLSMGESEVKRVLELLWL